MLSSLSLSAVLQRASVSWRGDLHVSGAWFLQLIPRGHPLIAWFWWLEELAFWGPMGLWQSQGWFLAGLRSLGHSSDSRLRHTFQSFCEGHHFSYPGASA